MNRALVILIILLLVITIFPATSFAAQTDYPFSVEIVLPENNIDQTGYYHVPGQPGETIALQAKITNLTDQPIEVSAIPLDAYSGLDGIFYQSPGSVDAQTFALVDESYGLAKYIQTQGTISIAPKGETTADVTVTVPAIDAGTLLGGIRFAVFAGTQNIQNENAGNTTILIDEYLAVDTAIQIDLPGAVEPALSCSTPTIFGQSLSIPIANRSAMIQENVSGSYEVRDSNDAVLFQGSISLPKMAPMTELRILKQWDNAWAAGDYTLMMELNGNRQPLQIKQPFTVGKKELQQVQTPQTDPQTAQSPEAAPPTEASSPAMTPSIAMTSKILSGFIIGVPVLIAGILLMMFIMKRRKQRRLRSMSGKRYVKT